MNGNMAFCEECRRDVEYEVSTKQMSGTIKGAEYDYVGKEAKCPECGAAVYVADIVESNLKALYDAYREANGLVSLEIVRAIPEKYEIGRRPLSLLLGWGEQTFTRYFDGDVPSRQYSDMLQRIYDDPKFYSELLEKNRGNLKSELSYRKSREAVDVILSEHELVGNKIGAISKYLISQCEDTTPLALQKALYYIQGFYYAFYKAFLFEEDCQAWVHGPVYKEIYSRYKDYHYDPIVKTEYFNSAVFSSGELTISDSIIKHLCCYSGKILERFTHNEAPWLITRGDLPVNAPSDRIIPKDLIGEYFASVKEKYKMVNAGDIEVYAKDMFQKC